MSVDYPDYQTPQAHATAIYGTRVPLARGVTLLASGTGKTLGGGLSVALTQQSALDQPSWEAVLILNLPAAAGTNPWAELTANWFVASNLIQSWTDTFWSAEGNGPGNTVTVVALGPCRGDSLSLSLANAETVQTLTYSYAVALISHTYDRPRWRQQNIPVTAPVGFTYPFADITSGVLCSTNPTVAASGNQARLLPAYLGRVRMQIDPAGLTANTLKVTITDPNPSIGGVPEYYTNTVGGVGPVREELWLPGRPVLLTLTNLSTTAAVTPQVTIVTSEY